MNAEKIAITICIISGFFIFAYGSDGNAKLAIVTVSFLSLLIAFILDKAQDSKTKGNFPSSLSKATKFTIAILMIIAIRNCGIHSSYHKTDPIECEYGRGGIQVCR